MERLLVCCLLRFGTSEQRNETTIGPANVSSFKFKKVDPKADGIPLFATPIAFAVPIDILRNNHIRARHTQYGVERLKPAK